ncbi:hypothetical protein HHE02_03730 [Helicobacter heilmannii]|uniref:Uncharacterized protein n=1 Tax=Helicobacter heilmannii TaxID=35817 RepID=A0A0K2XJ43_HELHE|nr:hypothetical protein BN341_350 [Helicobacter heilmannii ASB1.4]CRF45613.1 hypothetical protein HHE014_05800 [Helicobacter heilmannii]CRF47088.1 hypothetical protein HHE02_03730 [Helicobacter heilmannii]CRF48972.1 hypothetical protein HHE03_05660 [Helicobacter heilmannii]CRF50590.1 hypothetical protein HHE06_04300 [Helicobacter heilmannii]
MQKGQIVLFIFYDRGKYSVVGLRARLRFRRKITQGRYNKHD